MIVVEGINVEKEKKELILLEKEKNNLKEKIDSIERKIFKANYFWKLFYRKEFEKRADILYYYKKTIEGKIRQLKKYIKENKTHYEPGIYIGDCEDEYQNKYCIFMNRTNQFYSENIEIYFCKNRFSNKNILELSLIKRDKNLYIQDFLVKKEFQNMKIGTMAIKYLKEFAKQEKLELITGFLSEVDNRERLKKFYKLKKFEILNNGWEIQFKIESI